MFCFVFVVFFCCCCKFFSFYYKLLIVTYVMFMVTFYSVNLVTVDTVIKVHGLAFYLGSFLNMLTICLKHKWCCLLSWSAYPVIDLSEFCTCCNIIGVCSSSAPEILEKDPTAWSKIVAYTVNGNPVKRLRREQVAPSELQVMVQLGWSFLEGLFGFFVWSLVVLLCQKPPIII